MAGCVNMSDHRLQHFHVAPVQPYIQIIIIPSSPHIQRKPEFCWVFHQQKQIGRLQSVSLMQSCFSALTCRTLFPEQQGIKLTNHSPNFKNHFEASSCLRTTKIFCGPLTVLTIVLRLANLASPGCRSAVVHTTAITLQNPGMVMVGRDNGRPSSPASLLKPESPEHIPQGCIQCLNICREGDSTTSVVSHSHRKEVLAHAWSL